MDFSLIIPAFIAGILTFFAPCTLPLVPAYLAFISGIPINDLYNPAKIKIIKWKIFFNGVFYVVGFSLTFIILGALFGLGGAAFIKYRFWLSSIGGIFIIVFGLFMIGFFNLPFLNTEKHLIKIKKLKPGSLLSSLIFGITFAFGWTPCIGPILGSILTLAASSATLVQGAFLLAIFSFGLAIPFLIIAAIIGSITVYLAKISKYLNIISFISGIFLIFLGILLITNNFAIWTFYIYQLFDFINYKSLLDYL